MLFRMAVNKMIDWMNDIVVSFKNTRAKRKVKKITLGVHDLGNECNIFWSLI